MSFPSVPNGDDVTLSWGDEDRHNGLVMLALCALAMALAAAGIWAL